MSNPVKDVLRLARWQVRRIQAQQKFGCVDVPALFANSFPKSGTHLLTQVLAGFTKLGPFAETGLPAVTMFDGATGAARPVSELLPQLTRLRYGDIGYGHLHALPEMVEALCKPGVAPFFILRDPRDVVVSHVFYISELAPDHNLHQYYARMESFEAKLMTSIRGLPDAEFDFPDIAGRFQPYVGWLDRPEVLPLRFEDFLSDRQEALRQIISHVIERGWAFSGDLDQAADVLAGVIDPHRSPTFRSGRSGGWREHFTPEHKDVFKQLAGDLLIRLGYEEDLEW